MDRPNQSPPSTSSLLKTSIPAVHASSATAPSSTTYTPPEGKSPNPRHLAIALHHARHIQARKDMEAIIISHIEHLMTLPTSPTANAASPSEEDAAIFKSALGPFQPSDYDNLILERNIDGRCGYALCPKEHRREGPNTKFRILWGPKGSGPGGRGREMKVVAKEQLEKWCSDSCAERALYIRVQLSEKPAWERVDNKNIVIKLLEGDPLSDMMGKAERRDPNMSVIEDRFRDLTIDSTGEQQMQRGGQNTSALEDNLQNLRIGSPDDQKRFTCAAPGRLDTDVGGTSGLLTMERGDSPTIAINEDRMPVNITENPSTGAASAPILQPDSFKGGSIEGFHPRTQG